MRRAMIAAVVPLAAGMLMVGIAGCAAHPGSSDRTPTAHATSASPSPDASTTSTPGVPLPTEAARRWTLTSDPTLAIDLRTSDRILVRAGCVGFSGDLVTSSVTDDPAAGAPAGPTVAIRVTPLPDEPGTARCMGFTAAQREFVTAVEGARVLTVVGDRLYLADDADGRLEFVAAT